MDLILVPFLMLFLTIPAWPLIIGVLVIFAVYSYMISKLSKDEKRKLSYRRDIKIFLSGVIILGIVYLFGFLVMGTTMGINDHGNWRVCHGLAVGELCIGWEGERECCGLQTPLNVRRVGD